MSYFTKSTYKEITYHMSNRKKLHSNFYQTATTTKGMIEKKWLHKNPLKNLTILWKNRQNFSV